MRGSPHRPLGQTHRRPHRHRQSGPSLQRLPPPVARPQTRPHPLCRQHLECNARPPLRPVARPQTRPHPLCRKHLERNARPPLRPVARPQTRPHPLCRKHLERNARPPLRRSRRSSGRACEHRSPRVAGSQVGVQRVRARIVDRSLDLALVTTLRDDASSAQHDSSSAQHHAFSAQHQASSAQHQASSAQHHAFSAQHGRQDRPLLGGHGGGDPSSRPCQRERSRQVPCAHDQIRGVRPPPPPTASHAGWHVSPQIRGVRPPPPPTASHAGWRLWPQR